MNYRYFTCDVFTQTRFGGNPLAVLPEAEGLSDEQMQRIASEFNYSETTFVLPPSGSATRRVRIFMPSGEVPFAGHPNVGTAYVLAREGLLGPIGEGITVRFEELAGEVPVTVERREGDALWCELAAPEPCTQGRRAEAAQVAAALGLAEADIATEIHSPWEVSTGLPVVIAQATDEAAVARARVNLPAVEALAESGLTPHIYLYARDQEKADIHARMFAPLAGIAEDPATGSAACALAGLLADLESAGDGEFRWRITQGVEMGRPSLLEANAEKRDGNIVATGVGGGCVSVCEGVIQV